MPKPNTGEAEGDRSGKPRRGISVRHLRALEQAKVIVHQHAQLQRSVGGALREWRELDAVIPAHGTHATVASWRLGEWLEHVGGDASELAQQVVKLKDLLDPGDYRNWREVLRRAVNE